MRTFTVITFDDGAEILLDVYDDGTASVSSRVRRSDTWSPPVQVTVDGGVDGAESVA